MRVRENATKSAVEEDSTEIRDRAEDEVEEKERAEAEERSWAEDEIRKEA